MKTGISVKISTFHVRTTASSSITISDWFQYFCHRYICIHASVGLPPIKNEQHKFAKINHCMGNVSARSINEKNNKYYDFRAVMHLFLGFGRFHPYVRVSFVGICAPVSSCLLWYISLAFSFPLPAFIFINFLCSSSKPFFSWALSLHQRKIASCAHMICDSLRPLSITIYNIWFSIDLIGWCSQFIESAQRLSGLRRLYACLFIVVVIGLAIRSNTIKIMNELFKYTNQMVLQPHTILSLSYKSTAWLC